MEQAAETAAVYDWSFKPSEAFDAIVFTNATSTVDYYASHYPGLREQWAPRLGAHVLEAIANRKCSASTLSMLLHYVGVTTLDDVIRSFDDFPSTRSRIEQAIRDDPTTAEWLKNEFFRQLKILRDECDTTREVFVSIKKAGFSEHWQVDILPQLQLAAEEASVRMGAFPLEPVAERIARFIGQERAPAGTAIYLTEYARPIAFRLPGGGMVAGPGALPNPQWLVQLCVHETIHGFPGATEAIAEQQKLRADPKFDSQYVEFIEKYRSGPEEFFVIGAEAYLAVELGLTTHEKCIEYLDRKVGGVDFVKLLYLRLRECKPDYLPDWQGYGPWVTEELAAGRIWKVGGK